MQRQLASAWSHHRIAISFRWGQAAPAQDPESACQGALSALVSFSSPLCSSVSSRSTQSTHDVTGMVRIDGAAAGPRRVPRQARLSVVRNSRGKDARARQPLHDLAAGFGMRPFVDARAS